MHTPIPRVLSLAAALGLASFAPFAAAAAAAATPSQDERLTRAWESTDPLPGAAAALYDEAADTIYVARGEGSLKDGTARGFIARLGTDGKVLSAEWIAGLNSPRALAQSATRLFVADGQEILGVDPQRERIVSRYRNDRATQLRSIAVLDDGTVYAVDAAGGMLFELKGGIMGTHSEFDSLAAGTALAAAGPELILGQRSRITAFAPATLKRRDVVRRAAPTESLVALGDGSFLVADGKSAIHLVGGTNEKPVKLLDTAAPASGLGALGWVPKHRLVLVPLPGQGKVVAYRLK